MAQKIRSQYIEKQFTELDALRALDAKVKRPANIAAYVFGSISALVMGAGMSLTMTDLGTAMGMSNSMIPGIVIGVTGMGLTGAAYPVYTRTLKKEKEKIAPEILRLTEELMK